MLSMKGLLKNWKYAVLVIGLAVLATMIMDFNSRMTEWRRLQIQKDEVSTQEAQVTGTQAMLETQIAYATSDISVEEWARVQGHMAKPNDYVGVPVAPEESTPEPQPTTTVIQRPVSNWQLWLSLFIDPPSP